MILSKKDLIDCLRSDRAAMGFNDKNLIKQILLGREYEVSLMIYIMRLRKMELVQNRYNSKKTAFNFIRYYIWRQYFWWYRKKKNIFIDPNVFGPGLKIVHPGYIWVDNSAEIGSNCTILPRVLLGKKRPGIAPPIFL